MNGMFDHFGEALIVIAVMIAIVMAAIGFGIGWLIFG